MANIALKVFKTDELVKELIDRMGYGVIFGLLREEGEDQPQEVLAFRGRTQEMLGSLELAKAMVIQDFEMNRMQAIMEQAKRRIAIPDLKIAPN